MTKSDEVVPEWSCGAYVWESTLEPEFDLVEVPRLPGDPAMRRYQPVVHEPRFTGVEMLDPSFPIAKPRFLRREDCPVHGKGGPDGQA